MAVRIDGAGEALIRLTGLPAVNSFTISGWAYRHAVRAGEFQYFVSLENSTANSTGYALLGWANNGAFNFASESAYGVEASPPTGQWFYWFIRCDSGPNPDTYSAGWKVTGGAWTELSFNANLAWTPAMLTLGTDSFAEWCQMSFAHVRMWGAWLNNYSIEQEMAAQAPVRAANLMLAAALDTHTNLADSSGNGDLTAVGTLSTYTPGPFGGSSGLSASAALTQTANTTSAQAAVRVSASRSGAQASDVLAGQARVAANAALSAMQAANTLTGAASTRASGSLSSVQAGQVVIGAAAVRVSGAAAVAQAGNGLAGAAIVAVRAALGAAQGAQALTAAAALRVSGAAGVAQAPDGLAAVAALRVSAALSVTQAGDVLSAAVGGGWTLAAVQDGQTLAGAVAVAIRGAAGATQAGDGLAGQSIVHVAAVLTVVQDAQSASAGATVGLRGTVAADQDAQTLTGAASVALHAALNGAQAGDVLAGAALMGDAPARVATGALVQEGATLQAQATVRVSAVLTGVQDGDSVTGALVTMWFVVTGRVFGPGRTGNATGACGSGDVRGPAAYSRMGR